MKLLITGGAGFIGSNFIRYWLDTHPEDEIVNLDALTYAGNLENLKGIDESRYTFIQGDIAEPEIVHRAMEGVDTVVHFAAESHVDRSIDHSAVFVRTNVLGTHTLLEEARRRGDQIKRFHHISTDEVFGSLPLDTDDQFHEETRYTPRSPYAASKAASDHLVRAYFYTHNLPVTISSCANNYGPYMFPEKFIPVMIVNALQDKPIPIYGDGLNVRHWMHVLDHCKAIDAILERGKAGETYCLGGHEDSEKPNIAVAKAVLDFLQKPHSLISFVEDRKGHDRRYSTSDVKARRELGWKPETNFHDGVGAMVRWYIEHEDWWKPLIK
jgi:dTDP-glucose 4,6-dehydratase